MYDRSFTGVRAVFWCLPDPASVLYYADCEKLFTCIAAY